MMNSAHMVNNQRFNMRTAPTAAPVKWPWAYTEENVLELLDDTLCQRATGFAEFMDSSIVDLNEEQYLHRLETGKVDTSRTKVDSKAHVHTFHASTLVPATLTEVLTLFDDANGPSDQLTARTFRSLLISNLELRRIVSSFQPFAARQSRHTFARCNSDDAKSTVSSNVSTGSPSHRTILSFALKKAVFQESRGPFSKSPQRELFYLDIFEQLSPSTICRTIKSVDLLSESPTFTKGELPLERHQHVLMSYHIEAVGPTRVRMSFAGHYCYQHGMVEETKRMVAKFAEAVEVLPRLVFQTRLAAVLFSESKMNNKQKHTATGNACRLCARTFSAFMKQRLCRLCGQDICSSCSTVEQVPTANDLTIDARICHTCVETLKEGDFNPRQESSLTVLLSNTMQKALASPAASIGVRKLEAPALPTTSARRKNKAAASATRQTIVDDKRHDTLYDVTCMTAARRMGCDTACVTLVDETGNLVMKTKHGKGVDTVLVRETIHKKAACIVKDAAKDGRFSDPQRPSARFFYGLPLVLEDGLSVGVVSVSDGTPRAEVDEFHDTIMHDFHQTILRLVETARKPPTSAA
ncbi:hypothetical protein LEN26_014977 [Aphanomyces euteiches]|nr:hypothetical protein LEN26_014977 [Aphanomyces euteiches]KAH9108444.1 hypothetical protein AeMF1_016391 [Aphanomyces euteiches]